MLSWFSCLAVCFLTNNKCCEGTLKYPTSHNLDALEDQSVRFVRSDSLVNLTCCCVVRFRQRNCDSTNQLKGKLLGSWSGRYFKIYKCSSLCTYNLFCKHPLQLEVICGLLRFLHLSNQYNLIFLKLLQKFSRQDKLLV